MVLSVMRRLRYLYGVPSLDNFIFKLCYRWTVLLLVVFSFIITCKLKFGYSFYCASSDGLDSYATYKCYDGMSLYNSPELSRKNEYDWLKHTEDKHYLNYYSWVNLLFLVHAFNFYLPHLLWMSYERGYMYKLTAGIGIPKYLDKEDKHDLELCRLAKHVLSTQGKHRLNTLLYILCEIFNFIISLSHVLWLTAFFNITAESNSTPSNLNITLSNKKNFFFPEEAYCNFKKYGASGAIQQHQVLCQLPLNALYDKMYMFLNVWYIIITVLTGLMLIHRFFLLIPSFRTFICKISSSLSVTPILKSVCYQLSYSDWFFLSRLQYAMTDVDFAQMIDKIAIISQGKDPQSDEYKQFTILDDSPKDLDSTNITSAI